jgi:uncharacterized Ntn-hydrolase superfamily protein
MTFSIVAYDQAKKEFGVAISTALPAVGALAPFVSLRGAICTQSFVNFELGAKGISLLDANIPVDKALELLLSLDSEREIRQVHGLDIYGHRYAFTGKDCVPWCGHITRDSYTVAGNMLVGETVVTAMDRAFAAARAQGQELARSLVAALKAGQEAGGDKRGKQSAALLIASPEPKLYHNLRVDDSTDPVRELERLLAVATSAAEKIVKDYPKLKIVTKY